MKHISTQFLPLQKPIAPWNEINDQLETDNGWLLYIVYVSLYGWLGLKDSGLCLCNATGCPTGTEGQGNPSSLCLCERQVKKNKKKQPLR